MHNSYNENKSSEEIAIAAVEASCCFDDGSALPVLFQTIKLEGDK
ncbi:hypothetical protein RI845_17995 [Thalassotalea nanhaiensis]|uniref:Uncharacterized protein n=1 Tax=Thalassotalea nanhaiensis TaxID=3065648 RepID=A0ABY9TJG6_9GAMM|nr:hypothetical protein RI845_17995 [Colwelliaceae bacterium SQ345]